MIFFGTSSAQQLSSKKIEGSKCFKCGESEEIYTSVYTQYFHIWWIPFISLGKKGIAHCESCESTFKGKQMSSRIQDQIQDEKSKITIPIWHFIGVGLVCLLIASVIVFESINSKENAQFIKAPQAGDVYEYKTEDGHYTLFKVDAVDTDSIYFIVNSYESTSSKNILDLDMPNKYEDDIYVMSKETLLKMFEKREIIDVHRR